MANSLIRELLSGDEMRKRQLKEMGIPTIQRSRPSRAHGIRERLRAGRAERYQKVKSGVRSIVKKTDAYLKRPRPQQRQYPKQRTYKKEYPKFI